MNRRLGIVFDKNDKEAKVSYPIESGSWEITDELLTLYALLCDPVHGAELLRTDPTNREYGGAYVVRDYQYQLNRGSSNYEIFACARSVGKSESEINRAVTHPFRRHGESLLVTAPELVHLLPLTDNIEQGLNDSKLTQSFLDKRNGQTGFQHRPFQANFVDGTKIVGRIPRLKGPQPLDAPVLTPNGWRNMGDLKVGDLVVGSDGSASPIVRIAEMEDPEEVFEVEFTDGSKVICSGEHDWYVKTSLAGCEWQYRSTLEIAEDLKRSYGQGSRKEMWHIPMPPVVKFTPSPEPLPLDPYVLGVLLGDGSFSAHSVFLTCADREILDQLELLLPEGSSLIAEPRKYKYRIRGIGGSARNPVITALRDLGLLGARCETKFIPESYMRGTPEERLSLLQGLYDTDGTVTQTGKCEFTSKNERLVRQVAELARTLGGWASVRSQIHKPYMQTLDGKSYQNKGGTFWRVVVVLNDPICRLTRKSSRLRPRKHARHRSIRAITSVGVTEVRCFRLDTHDHIYFTSDLCATSQTGVKGQHQPDLIVEEGQDYPEAGWVEVHETVSKDHVDSEGNPDFKYEVFGVHSGARDSGFAKRATQGGFKVTQVTAIQRPGWGAAEKQAAIAAYGGSNAPDYKRNILGEVGGAATALFNMARLMATVDQDRDSEYNTREYVHQEIRSEQFEQSGMSMAEILDLPGKEYSRVWAGADLGLTQSPTVIVICAEEKVKGEMRLKLIRRTHLVQMRTRRIREAIYAIFSHFGGALQGFAVDETGLGFPVYQEIEDDEAKPEFVAERFSGWFFNAKVPVGIEKGLVSKDQYGNLRDQYGASVTERVNDLTHDTEYVVNMPMIEASTRYIRKWVDSTYLLLPFDPGFIGDMMGDTAQRIKRIAGLKNKPNAYHDLDALRALSMAFTMQERAEAIAVSPQVPVLDLAV